MNVQSQDQEPDIRLRAVRDQRDDLLAENAILRSSIRRFKDELAKPSTARNGTGESIESAIGEIRRLQNVIQTDDRQTGPREPFPCEDPQWVQKRAEWETRFPAVILLYHVLDECDYDGNGRTGAFYSLFDSMLYHCPGTAEEMMKIIAKTAMDSLDYHLNTMAGELIAEAEELQEIIEVPATADSDPRKIKYVVDQFTEALQGARDRLNTCREMMDAIRNTTEATSGKDAQDIETEKAADAGRPPEKI